MIYIPSVFRGGFILKSHIVLINSIRRFFETAPVGVSPYMRSHRSVHIWLIYTIYKYIIMSAIKLSEFCIMIYCLLFKNTHSHTHQTN